MNFVLFNNRCNDCKITKSINLANGNICCSWCYKYLVECEAREILKMPIEKRRIKLNKLIEKRGNVEKLKQSMIDICKLKK